MKTFISSIKFTIVAAVLLFVGYVLVLWGFAAIVTPAHGEAQMISVNRKDVGVANVGQQFSSPKYFWGRPSACHYDGSASCGSNKGPTNEDYLQDVRCRIDTFLKAHPYLHRKDIPSELVTASGSGLDPHISPLAAEVQVRRVAEARHISVSVVRRIMAQYTHTPLLGPSYVNLLSLNSALDTYANQRSEP